MTSASDFKKQDGKTNLEDVQSTPVVSVLRYEDSLSRAGATKAFVIVTIFG